MKYKIREISSDAALMVVRVLHDRCFGDEAPVPDLTLGWWWLAWEKDHLDPIGFAGMVRSRQYPLTMAYLIRAGVMPAHRGHDLHSRLIKARELKAKKMGVTCLVTDTFGANASSNNLAKAGFKLYTPETRWAFKQSLYWRKAIA